jgi:hypothetical protein
MAGRRETDDLKPIDKAILGMVSESPGRNKGERDVASKRMHSGGRAIRASAKTAWTNGIWLRRQSTPAGFQRWHGDKDTSSNWRSPPRPGKKFSEKDRSYNREQREVERRREGDGWVRSSGEAG